MGTFSEVDMDQQRVQMMAGERGYAECWGDMEQKFIIDEIRKAFEAGRASALSRPQQGGS